MGIDKSVIKMHPSGWKISYFVQDIVDCDFLSNPEQLKVGMGYIHKTHEIPISFEAKIFDNVREGKKLMEVASRTKGNLFDEFKEVIEKVEIIDEYVKQNSKNMVLIW